MRCSEAKRGLAAQRDGDLAQSDIPALQEHLKQCPACRAFEQRLQCLNTLLLSPTPRSYSSISTDRILLAVQHQKHIHSATQRHSNATAVTYGTPARRRSTFSGNLPFLHWEASLFCCSL